MWNIKNKVWRNIIQNIINIILDSAKDKTFIKAIISNPRNKSNITKVTIKPITIKSFYMLQFISFDGKKEFHENISLNDLESMLSKTISLYKQIQIYTVNNDYQCLLNKKLVANIKKQNPSQAMPDSISHNKEKNYILNDKIAANFWTRLDIMDKSGKIKPSKYDKYKQINKYLEFIEGCISDLPKDNIRIIDFGCGKSYLTFALYYYLTNILNKKVTVVGLDLKEDVIKLCNKLADDLGFENLHFQVGDIGKYTTNERIDMVVSLHACNTATDFALQKAINWGSKVILAVPCCHNEAYTQIKNEDLIPILKHGILKEKIAALITDGLRAQLLESCGYKVNVMEFIDVEHTPKNVLIKAVLDSTVQKNENAYEKYTVACNKLNLDLTLNKLLEQDSIL